MKNKKIKNFFPIAKKRFSLRRFSGVCGPLRAGVRNSSPPAPFLRYPIDETSGVCYYGLMGRGINAAPAVYFGQPPEEGEMEMLTK